MLGPYSYHELGIEETDIDTGAIDGDPDEDPGNRPVEFSAPGKKIVNMEDLPANVADDMIF